MSVLVSHFVAYASPNFNDFAYFTCIEVCPTLVALVLVCVTHSFLKLISNFNYAGKDKS